MGTLFENGNPIPNLVKSHFNTENKHAYTRISGRFHMQQLICG